MIPNPSNTAVNWFGPGKSYNKYLYGFLTGPDRNYTTETSWGGKQKPEFKKSSMIGEKSNVKPMKCEKWQSI